MPDTNITLTCTWGRAPLPASGSPQIAYLLVEAQAAAKSEAVPLNFCMVLDRSGSMQGAKLAAMKDATKRVIDTLTPQDIVAIVLFAIPAADDPASAQVSCGPLFVAGGALCGVTF